ncbi:MAG TPA: glycosyltransferase [Azospirillum sp.]|nr:glycosyltransferase [Azospirillum sp.]
MRATATPPAFSVVIPTRDRAHLIGETLDAVLGQSLPPRDVIVVDDGSDDGTAEMLEGYRPWVRCARIPPSGVCTARNVGAALATGTHVAFCDSDDVWAPDHLRHHHRLHTAAPDIPLSFGNHRRLGEGEGAADKFAQAPDTFWDGWRAGPVDGTLRFDGALYERLLAFQPIFPSALVVRRDVLWRLGGFDERFNATVSEDFEFMLRATQQGPVAAVTPALVGIRRHAGNLSARQSDCLIGEIAILEHALTHHDAARRCAAALRTELLRRRVQAVHACFAAGRLDALAGVAARLPASTGGRRLAVKLLIARLPRPLARAAWRLLCGPSPEAP